MGEWLVMGKDVYGYIYMVKNLVNGKLYFGITENDFDTRYSGNISKYTHNDHLKNSINTYGIENFEINECFDIAYSEDELYDLEDMYICLYNTLNDNYGYNKRRSGYECRGHGKMSEESKRKMSESQKALYEQGYVNPCKGITKTEEQKQKIRDSLANMSEEDKLRRNNKMSEARQGKKLSMETRLKQSKSKQGHECSDDTKKKIGKSNSKVVICLETLQVFDNATKAGEWCGVGRTSINNYLNNRSKYAGKHPITNEKLHWMYYEDYLKLNDNEHKDSDNNQVA